MNTAHDTHLRTFLMSTSPALVRAPGRALLLGLAILARQAVGSVEEGYMSPSEVVTTDVELARLLGMSPDAVRRLMDELEDMSVLVGVGRSQDRPGAEVHYSIDLARGFLDA